MENSVNQLITTRIVGGFVSRENAVKYIIRLKTLNIESKMTRVEYA